MARWKRLDTRIRRISWSLVLAPTLVLLTAGGAAADDGTTAPSALSWIKIEDSEGVSIWKYEMSLDRGGVTGLDKFVWSWLVDMTWGLYRVYIAFAIWIIDWTLSFEWVQMLAGPVMKLGDSLQMVVDQFGVGPTLLTIAALVAATWMARGRWALGVFELFMSLVISSLAVGILANPVRMVADEGGMLTHSRDTGLEVAAGLKNGGETTGSPEELREEVTAMIADTFIRNPHQLVNFGKVLDGGDCAKAYQDALQDGPYGTDDDLRDAVGDCDEDAGDVAENPNAGMLMSMFALGPAGSIAVLFAVILCGVVLVAGTFALYQSLKMIVALVFALLPGGARGTLWMTLAELVISYVTIVFSVVFLSAYMLLIQSVFDSSDGNNMKTFFIVDVLLLVGIVVFWKGRQRLKAASDRLAQAMSKRPGGAGPSSLPSKVRTDFSDSYYKGKMAVQGAKIAGTAAAATGASAAAVATGAAKTAYAPVGTARARLRFASWAAANQPADDETTPEDRLNDRLKDHRGDSRKGQLARLGGTAVLALATGGTSTAVSAGARVGGQAAVAAARRAALDAKFRAALPPGGSDATATTGSPVPEGPSPQGQARPAAPRISSPATQAPAVVRGEVISSTHGADDPAARLRARLDARAIALPGPNGRRGRP